MIDPESLAVEPVEADPRPGGLVSGPDDPDFATDRIVPRRPLPIETFRRLGGDPRDEVIAVERVRQPYYDSANPPSPRCCHGRDVRSRRVLRPRPPLGT